MPAITPTIQDETPEPSNRNALLAGIFAVISVTSGVACCVLSRFFAPRVQAAGLDEIWIDVALFVAGLIGLWVSLGPVTKTMDIEARPAPVEG